MHVIHSIHPENFELNRIYDKNFSKRITKNKSLA